MTDDLNPGDLDGFTLVPTSEDDYDTIGLPRDTILLDEWSEREGFNLATGEYDHETSLESAHAHGPRRASQDSIDPDTMIVHSGREYRPSNVLFDSRDRLELVDINSDWYPTGKDAGLFPLCHECGNQLVEDEGLARCCVCAFQVTRRRLLANNALDDAD